MPTKLLQKTGHLRRLLEHLLDRKIDEQEWELMSQSGVKIKHNKGQCLKCNDIIESRHVHDMVYCSCGDFALDGGQDYIRVLGNADRYKLLTEYE